MTLKKRFNELDPKKKKIVIWSGIGIVFLVLVSTGYNSSQSDMSEGYFGQKKTREIQLEPDLIQKTMLREQRRQLETLQEAVDKIQREQKRSEQSANTPKVLPEIPTADQVAQKTETPPPPTEKQPWPLPSEGSSKTSLPTHPKPEPQMIGEISVLSNPRAVPEGPAGPN